MHAVVDGVFRQLCHVLGLAPQGESFFPLLIKGDFIIKAVLTLLYIADRQHRQQGLFIHIGIIAVVDFVEPLIRFVGGTMHREMILVFGLFYPEGDFASSEPNEVPVVVQFIDDGFPVLKSTIRHRAWGD